MDVATFLVKVSLKRSGKKSGRKTAPRAYAPRFPKQKDEGYRIVLGKRGAPANWWHAQSSVCRHL